MNTVTFSCDRCGTKRTERMAWYKKRLNHYCSRSCANKSNAEKNATGMTKSEYSKWYWSQPENKERRKLMAKKNWKLRQSQMGLSYVKAMLVRCKYRAERKGIEFNLTENDVNIPKNCPVLKIKLEPNDIKGGSYNSPSLDRIDNTKGYVKGNVHVISKRANMIKTDATIEEIEAVLKYFKRLSFQP